MLAKVFPDILAIFSDKIPIAEKICSNVMHKEWLQLLEEVHFISSPETEGCSEIARSFCGQNTAEYSICILKLSIKYKNCMSGSVIF